MHNPKILIYILSEESNKQDIANPKTLFKPTRLAFSNRLCSCRGKRNNAFNM